MDLKGIGGRDRYRNMKICAATLQHLHSALQNDSLVSGKIVLVFFVYIPS